MKCRSCGLEIAEKAIVCYRCGTPTAVTAPTRPVPPGAGPKWPLVSLMLGIMAMAVWLVLRTPVGTAWRWGAWIAVVAVTAAAVYWLRTQSRASGPRR